jgi:hypothetical protein
MPPRPEPERQQSCASDLMRGDDVEAAREGVPKIAMRTHVNPRLRISIIAILSIAVRVIQPVAGLRTTLTVDSRVLPIKALERGTIGA